MSEDKAVIAPPRADYLLRLALEAIEAGASAPLVMNVAGLKQAIRHHLDSKPATEQADPDSLRDHIRRAHMKLSCAQEAVPLARTVLVSEALESLDAAMATQPARAPLTEEQIDDMLADANRGFCIERDDYIKAVRDTERAHGIGEAG